MSEVPTEIITLLSEGKFTYFCTIDDALNPHVTPMFFFYDIEKNRVYLISSRSSQKVRNLQYSHFVSLTVDLRDPSNPFFNRGAMVQGTSRVTEIAENSWVIKMFANKYPKLVEREELGKGILREPHDVMIEVTPRLMVHWRGPDFIRWKAPQDEGGKASH